jgi:beta-glucosidase
MKLIGDAAERTILETAAVNPNTIVVLFAGSVIDMSKWEDKVAAILYCGFPGEKGAEAVVNVLTGKVNPSGKLSETFPIHYEDSPASFTYIDSRVTRYQDGIDVGYRYYDKYGVKVQYPFGHGLSYSKFEYDNLHIEEVGDSTFEVSYNIKNVSEIDGKEVSQVYVREISPLVYRPLKELKNFSKDMIKAGDTKTIKLTLQEKDFAHYSTAEDKWIVTNGVYEILIGASVSDVRLVKRILLDK